MWLKNILLFYITVYLLKCIGCSENNRVPLERAEHSIAVLRKLKNYLKNTTSAGRDATANDIESFRMNLKSWFSTLDDELNKFNKLSASIAWDMAIEKNNLTDIGTTVGILKNLWRNSVCDTEVKTDKELAKRVMYLLCRGPKYTEEQSREISQISDKLSEIYTNTQLCADEKTWRTVGYKGDKLCLKGEPDIEMLMQAEDISANQLFSIWSWWYDTVGRNIKYFYPELVKQMNAGAINNGYNNIGECWQEELEIKNLESFSKYLYDGIFPLYEALHAVVRHKLVERHGKEHVDPRGPIPAHLLGNLWSQDWSDLFYLFYPNGNLKLNENLAEKNWTAKRMVEMAEDFYISLGLPKMTKRFWKYSKIERTNSSMCHGSAANMFDEGDYRMLLCAELNMDDFYVIHHEMGHIEYYMAYKDLPTIFQDGANSAFQESIGDAIMTGVMAPQHLHRLGLISDDQLYNESLQLNEMLMLQQALTKIPQIPYALMTDTYRWNIFNGKIKSDSYNAEYWKINEELRGIKPPENRDNSEYFDAGAKFHVADNTPYIRYFLSQFIHMDIYKSLCQWTVFGKVSEESLPFPLHRCDIYGSRTAGKELQKFMSMGSSQHWSQIYKPLTGRNYISYDAVLEYFQPLYGWLRNYILRHNVYVGW